MANFCTKCGSALQEGTKFCVSCGTPLGGTTAPAASASQAAAAPVKGGNALKVVLIVLGVFVGIGILTGAAAMFGLWRFSRAVNVDSSTGQVTVSTPGGKVTLATAEVSEAELGVPLYPGAKRDEGSFRVSTAEGSMATYLFKTSASPAQVMAFYRGKVGPKAAFVESADGGMISSDKDEKEGFLITVGREDDGRTTITIVRGRSKNSP